MRIESVTSPHNPRIKDLLNLQEKSRERKDRGVFVVEGVRELEHCMASGFEVDTVFYCPSILGKSSSFNMDRPELSSSRLLELPEVLYSKVAYRGGTEGIIAEVKCKDRSLDDIRTGESPLVVVLEGVEKPGNLGAVLRSADAAGADAVIICDPLTDLYNPNLIRASIGAVFTVPVVCCSSEEAIKWLKDNHIQILTAQLQDSEWYYDTDMKRGTAIVVGTESTGLTDRWRLVADARVKIPMLGQLDSLNASVSAAILLFEAVRQRNS